MKMLEKPVAAVLEPLEGGYQVDEPTEVVAETPKFWFTRAGGSGFIKWRKDTGQCWNKFQNYQWPPRKLVISKQTTN